MAEAAPTSILRAIRRVAEDQRCAGVPDAELLRRFLERRDEAAFHALLRRHGPMVLDVCRAVVPNRADAEDAFQAAFLVFLRNARRVRKAASLASWLHGVARRTALKARVAFARRRKHEGRAPARPLSGPDDLTWRELRQVLHQELARLAERYRAPLVLCYLQGKTQDEAAALLGLAKGTLRGGWNAAGRCCGDGSLGAGWPRWRRCSPPGRPRRMPVSRRGCCAAPRRRCPGSPREARRPGPSRPAWRP
jgi:RNA polymerase sigma factor (sigma-70 family)